MRFLAGPARASGGVWILGDLFEYWIGDDAGLADYAPEVAALRGLTAQGLPVRLLHGNRDFLVGGAFAAATGVRLEADPCVVELGGQRGLLTHGDAFCTDDRGYQRWRAFSRNRLAQAVFRRLPRATRAAIAGGLRSGSQTMTQRKPEDILDVNEDSVRAAFARHGVTRIVQGHTHRPAEHHYTIAGRACARIVLADWRPERMEYLELAEDGGLCRRTLAAP